MPRAAPGSEPARRRPTVGQWTCPRNAYEPPPKSLVTLAISTSEPTAREGGTRRMNTRAGVSRAPPPVEVTPTTNPATIPMRGAVRSIVPLFRLATPRFPPPFVRSAKKQKARGFEPSGPRVRRFVSQSLVISGPREHGGIAEAEGLPHATTATTTRDARNVHVSGYTRRGDGRQG